MLTDFLVQIILRFFHFCALDLEVFLGFPDGCGPLLSSP